MQFPGDIAPKGIHKNKKNCLRTTQIQTNWANKFKKERDPQSYIKLQKQTEGLQMSSEQAETHT